MTFSRLSNWNLWFDMFNPCLLPRLPTHSLCQQKAQAAYAPQREPVSSGLNAVVQGEDRWPTAVAYNAFRPSRPLLKAAAACFVLLKLYALLL